MNLYNSINQIEIVKSFEDFISKPFHDEVNAIGLLRNTEANFKEIVDKFLTEEDIIEISIADLDLLELSDSGVKAKNMIKDDYNNLLEAGCQPTLNLINKYMKDDEFDFISTDVYSFHVDRSPIPTSTILCTYYGASSDIISNDEVVQKILVPEIRKNLNQLYDENDGSFEDFLEDNFFDLHYQELPNANPINLGNINIWRLAVDNPYQNVKPCVHRAPIENINEPRLLLIC